MIALAGIALVLRLALLPLAPRYGYLGDHDDFVRWGVQAVDHGILTLYREPPARMPIQSFSAGQSTLGTRQFDRVCNYPPGTIYLLYSCGLLFRATSTENIVNTVLSRAVFAAWPIIADLLVAAGCAAIVSRFQTRRAALWTYAIVLFMPPMCWDSVIWGQVDSLLIAPMIWMVWAMLARRWKLAGVLFGLGSVLKPQAILFVPVWGWALLAERPIRKPIGGLGLAMATAILLTLPFTLTGGLAWLQSSYAENLLHAYPATTLKAFNIWYPDLLVRDVETSSDKLLGLARDTWGRLLLMSSLAAGFVLMYPRRHHSLTLLIWSGWVLLAAVMLPTRVHERYLLIALPFLIAAACSVRRLWVGVVALIVVATAQVTWPIWMSADAGGWLKFEAAQAVQYQTWLAQLPPEQRKSAETLEAQLAPARQQYLQMRSRTSGVEWLMTLLAITAAGYTWIVSVLHVRRLAAEEASAPQPVGAPAPGQRAKSRREKFRGGTCE